MIKTDSSYLIMFIFGETGQISTRKISVNPRPVTKWLHFKFSDSNHRRIIKKEKSCIVPDQSLARVGLDAIFYHVFSGKVYKLWQIYSLCLFILELIEFSCLNDKS